MSISQNYPTVRPQLLIDIANTEVLDPRVASSRASVATYYDENGVLQTAPDNVARVGYDPVTGACTGLIRESQGTNLVKYSEDFANASWVKGGLTITSNTVVAPDGALTGDKLVENTATDLHYLTIGGGVAVTSGVLYTFTVFAKSASTRRLVLVTSSTGFGANKGAIFDLNAGTISDISTTTTATITNVGNGFYRCSITVTATSTAISNFNLVINNGTSSLLSSYTGDGYSGIYLWGAQLEANAFPTSYIKTVASQVTRAADSFLLTNVDAYNTAEFTAISQPFGVTSVSTGTVTLNGDVPIERLYVYPNNVPQDEINAVVENDGWWSWRIVGATFALPSFSTDGSIQVDWGDGTVETLTTAVHTFTNASPHTIRFRQMTGTWFRPRINSEATYAPMVVGVGSAPSNMLVDCNGVFYGCTNLKSLDATFVGLSSFFLSWHVCSSLTSFPLIDTSLGTNFDGTWNGCGQLKSFPLINTSSATNFTRTWFNCAQLQSFPLINTSSVDNFTQTWSGCTGLTSFPLIDMSSGTYFTQTWRGCSSLTSFPLVDMSAGTTFSTTFRDCTSLTSFPLINMNLGTNFTLCWYGCTSMTDFPANFFDSWTGTPLSGCFSLTWDNCFALTTTSVENILVSIDTSGTSAPAGNTEITIDYNVATGALTTPTTDAITSLKGKNWTIKINGVLQ